MSHDQMSRSIRRAVWPAPILLTLLIAASLAAGARPTRAQATAEATIQNFAYAPATLTVTAGTTVTWTQRDTAPHTVTSGAPGSGAGLSFDSPRLNQGDAFPIVFTDSGTYAYFCRFHPNMRGVVQVQGPPTGAAALAATQPTPTPAPASPPAGGAPAALPANVTPVATGLLNPRGFTWGPDGALYVAESGTLPAGYRPPSGPPDPSAPPVTNMNGRISRIDAAGRRTTVVGGLPVFVGPASDTIGAAGVAFIGPTLYAIISAGPAHGHPDFPGGVYRVNANGTLTLIADTDAFNVANPPAFIPVDDELSNPYDMVALGGKLYITDGNRSVITEVDPATGGIRYLADMSEGHPVLTGITAGPDGALYVTNLTPVPFPAGAAQIWRVTLDGNVTPLTAGLSAATGIATDPEGRLYVAEIAGTIPEPPFFVPPGRIVVMGQGGVPIVVAAPIFFPTILRWGPDGLYGTSFSVGGDAGTGAIIRIAS